VVTLESDVRKQHEAAEARQHRTPRGPVGPPPEAPPALRGRPAFEVFVAILSAIALVVGFYAFGQAIENDGPATAPTGGGDAPSSGDESGGADAAPAQADGAHAHGVDGDGDGSASEPTDDKGLSSLENGQMIHDWGPDQPLDEATRAALTHQLALTRDIAAQYPTLQSARDAGRFRAGPFTPGLGTHMIAVGGFNPEGDMTDEDVLNPQTIIYDGSEPDSPIAGFMYYSTSAEEPEGFAGPNDHWHFHKDVCIVSGPDGIEAPLGADRSTTKEACDAFGGNLMAQTNWMVHVWTIPGYESNRGVFSDINPALACADGTYYMVPENEWAKYPANVCRDNPS
jgi:hypothetical protein